MKKTLKVRIFIHVFLFFSVTVFIRFDFYFASISMCSNAFVITFILFTLPFWFFLDLQNYFEQNNFSNNLH